MYFPFGKSVGTNGEKAIRLAAGLQMAYIEGPCSKLRGMRSLLRFKHSPLLFPRFHGRSPCKAPDAAEPSVAILLCCAVDGT
jgi:hypothetical protein